MPLIVATTATDVFWGQGYAQAQDRMFQADVIRRVGSGRLAELLGCGGAAPTACGNVASDRFYRGFFGGKTKLRALYQQAPKRVRAAVDGFVAGFNAEIADATKAGTLPLQYGFLGAKPAPWAPEDVVAATLLAGDNVGGFGYSEFYYASELAFFQDRVGVVEGTKVFDDTHWFDDPSAPTTIRGSKKELAPAVASPTTLSTTPSTTPSKVDPRFVAVAARQALTQAAVTKALAIAGIVKGHASNAVVLAGELTKSGHPLLLGGPQVGQSAPSGFWASHLKAPGIDVSGVSLPGTIGVQIGVAWGQKGHAWTVTSGISNNNDWYAETVDAAGHPGKYLYKGTWTPFACHEETYAIKGASPFTAPVCTTVHGTSDQDFQDAVLRSASNGNFGRLADAFMTLATATSIEEFGRGVDQIPVNLNLFYADATHIGYWHAGDIPIEPKGVNQFLPRSGEGDAEWQGFVPRSELPHVIDPASGFIGNWNNKPAPGWPGGASPFGTWGPSQRVQVILDQLAEIKPGSADLSTLESINRRTGETATAGLDESAVIAPSALPVLVPAIDAKADARLKAVKARLAAWDGRRVDGDANGTYDQPEATIFDAWMAQLSADLLDPKLGVGDAFPYVDSVLRAEIVMRAVQGASAGRPNTANWLGSKSASAAVTASLVRALDGLTSRFGSKDVTKWLSPQLMTTWFIQGLGPVPNTPFENRGSYNLVVSLANPIQAVDILPPGESGDPRSAHYSDQLQRYVAWQYKPMR